MKAILLMITLTGCASMVGYPTLKTSKKVFPKYFEFISKKDKKGAFNILNENIAVGSDSYNQPQNNGFAVMIDDKQRSIIRYGSKKAAIKTFIEESLIVDRCGKSKNPKACFYKSYKSIFPDKISKYKSAQKEDLDRELNRYCAVPCDDMSSMCLMLSSSIGESWKNGQQFVEGACNE